MKCCLRKMKSTFLAPASFWKGKHRSDLKQCLQRPFKSLVPSVRSYISSSNHKQIGHQTHFILFSYHLNVLGRTEDEKSLHIKYSSHQLQCFQKCSHPRGKEPRWKSSPINMQHFINSTKCSLSSGISSILLN